MSKKDPKWFANLAQGKMLVAIGATTPDEPVYGGVSGQNAWGDKENCLVYPSISPRALEQLRSSHVPSVAVHLRDNLLEWPNRLWQDIKNGEVTWVVYEFIGTAFKPVMAFIGEKPVAEDLFFTINDSVARVKLLRES